MNGLKSALALFVAVIFASCNFSNAGIPEEVYVKTSGTFSGAAGEKFFDLSEKFGDTFISDMAEKTGGDVYKYIPDPEDKVMKYLLHKKIYDVPLDVGKYLDGVKLDDMLSESMNFEKEIALPSLSKNGSVPILAGATGPLPFEITLTVSMDSLVKAATIGVGSIVIQAAGSGAEFDISAFTLEGLKNSVGGDYGPGDFVDKGGDYYINKELDLSGAELQLPLTQIKASGSLVLSSGSVSAPSQLVCKITAETFSSATVDLSGVGGFKMDNTTENKKTVPKEMVAYVQGINFGQTNAGVYYKSDADGAITTTKAQGKGIKFKAVNSFPAGNDIQLDIVSETFGIDSTDGLIYEDGALATAATIPAKGNADAFDKSFAEFSDINVTDHALFGTASAPAWIKFKVELSSSQNFVNLALGQTYKIAVSDMQMLFDWDKVDMNLSNIDPVEDSVDMSDFSFDAIVDQVDGEISKLIDNCEFDSVPVYFLVRKPEGSLASEIGSATINGKAFFKYTDSTSAVKTDYIAGDSGSTIDMPFCEAFAWPDSGSVVEKVFAAPGVDYSFHSDIADTLNERPKDLAVNYSMGIAGGSVIELYKARFDTLGDDESTSIGVEMAAVLPFKVNVITDTDLDVYKLAEWDTSDEKDLMFRTEVSKTEEFAKYSGAISTLQLKYNFINKGVEGFDAVVKVDDTHQGKADASSYSGIVRTLELTGSSSDAIVFTNDEIKAALTHFFMPDMTMTVKQGTLSLTRDAVETKTALGINPTVFLQLNDSVAVNIKDIIK